MTRQKTLFAGAIALLALLAGALFAAVILKPIRLLSSATDALAGGNLAARVATQHHDELGRLGGSFNAMAEPYNWPQRTRGLSAEGSRNFFVTR
jgi:nitrogen fixation/metabolism regulation signal transduction histidine kinase